jgi:CRP/FNR family transcriptional regulator, cyclic AMP receptor protein
MDEERLKAIPLFAGLNRKERRALAPRADEVELEQGRVIVREGEWAYEFFAIEEGTAEVRRGDQLLAELGPGDFFGEMGLVGDTRRNANVIASSPLKVVVMTAQAFRQTSRELPEVAAKIRAAIEERCRHLEVAG